MDDELGEPVLGAAGGRVGALDGRSGDDDWAGCGRKLAVDRGGEFGTTGGGLLLTGGFAAGRAAGAGAGAAEAAGAADEVEADRPGVVGRPVPPPFARARAAALSATPAPVGRAARCPPPLDDDECGGSAGGLVGAAEGRDDEAAAGREAEPDPAEPEPLNPAPAEPAPAEPAPADPALTEPEPTEPAPDPADPELDAPEPDPPVLAPPEPEAAPPGDEPDPVPGRVADVPGRTVVDDAAGAGGTAALLAAAGAEPAGEAAAGRPAAWAGRTRLVASSPTVGVPALVDLPADESPGSLDFTSVASVVIGFAPPPGIC